MSNKRTYSRPRAADLEDSSYDPAERGVGKWDVEDEGEDLWQRLSRVTTFLIVVSGLALILVLFKPQIEKRAELHSDVNQLTNTYNELTKRADREHARLDWLRSDLNYLEIEARDRLDLKKEGEHVIQIVRP